MTDTIVDVVALIRRGNFARLRDELERLRPQELAASFCEWRPDDQVIAFRILPRRSAAALFEYLPPDCQRSLVKAMGQADVAALLNNVSPDDRLPVTDTAGVLIGIVTVDDALDVAEEVATREFQLFGGSEALDEPYMQISLARMVKKRGGWLVVLFLGLAAGGIDGRAGPDRRRVVGNAGWLGSAIRAAAPRVRPGHIVGAVCRHAR